MKIAILTSGILPVPAVQGGAVENLIDFYLDYNDKHQLHEITVYSVFHKNVKKHPALNSTANHYEFIEVSNIYARLRRKLYGYSHHNEYYNHYIEFFFEQCYKKLTKKEYDIIILENRPGYAYKLSQRGINNIYLHLHNDLLNATTSHSYEILQSLTKVVTVSNYIKERVNTIGKTGKVQTLYNGINLNLFSKESCTPIERSNLGIDKGEFVIVYSGRINPEKGISELIDAMILIKDRPQIKLLVIGSPFFGETSDSDFFRSLNKKAESIKKNIIFTGYIHYQEVPNYLNMADIAVLPSKWEEPFGLTCVEAMAAGLPIITTNKGGIPEVVNNSCAILLDSVPHLPSLSRQIADSIIELYNNPVKRKTMSLESLKRSRLFDSNDYVKRFWNIFTT